MPSFAYQGRNIEGKSVHGIRLSQSAELLATQLLREGITPVSIIVKSETKSKTNFIENLLMPKSVQLEDLAMFSRQMYTLLKSSVPVTLALRQLSENARTTYMSEILNNLIEGLESGRELVTAMQSYSDFFSPVMIGMLQVGQASGHLDEAFLRLSQYLELESSALKGATSALRYPAFVLLSVIAAFLIVTGWVIPTFARIFQQANVPLPIMTRFLMWVSSFISNDWIFIVCLIVLIISSIIYWLRTSKGRYQWGKYQLKIPIVGKILQRIILLRFTQSFAMVVSSGIPLIEGIRLVSETTQNRYASEEIKSLRDSILHGLTLTRAIAASKLFTPLEIQMLNVSEETGEVAAMLEQIASYYRREVEYDLKRLNDVIEPVMIIGLAVVVLVLAFAVYLPIWNMIKLVHH